VLLTDFLAIPVQCLSIGCRLRDVNFQIELDTKELQFVKHQRRGSHLSIRDNFNERRHVTTGGKQVPLLPCSDVFFHRVFEDTGISAKIWGKEIIQQIFIPERSLSIE